MQNKWDALKGKSWLLLIAVCLLAAGVGGYYWLQEPAPAVPETANTPTTEIPVTAPVPEIRHEEPVSAPDPDPIPTAKPEELPAPEAEFIPDSTPVIVTPPKITVTPLDGEVVAAFSTEQLVYNDVLDDWRTHDGVDIAAPLGSDVLAASSGTVISVEDDPLMGTTVMIDHEDGCRTTYANLQSDPAVTPGDLVSAGQRIGTVGNSAAVEASQEPHLHFSVSKDGSPMDPMEYLH